MPWHPAAGNDKIITMSMEQLTDRMSGCTVESDPIAGRQERESEKMRNLLLSSSGMDWSALIIASASAVNTEQELGNRVERVLSARTAAEATPSSFLALSVNIL